MKLFKRPDLGTRTPSKGSAGLLSRVSVSFHVSFHFSFAVSIRKLPCAKIKNCSNSQVMIIYSVLYFKLEKCTTFCTINF